MYGIVRVWVNTLYPPTFGLLMTQFTISEHHFIGKSPQGSTNWPADWYSLADRRQRFLSSSAWSLFSGYERCLNPIRVAWTPQSIALTTQELVYHPAITMNTAIRHLQTDPTE